MILVKNYLRQEVAAINLLDATNRLNLPKFGLGYNGTLVRFSSMNDTTEEIMDAGWSRSLIVQPVPKFLRGFGENGKLSRFKPILRRILALSFVVIVKPISLVKLLMRRSRTTIQTTSRTNIRILGRDALLSHQQSRRA